MFTRWTNTLSVLVMVGLAGAAGRAAATELVPQSDTEVVEVLPAAAGSRAEERKLRRQWAANPRDAVSAAALARRYLDQARGQGDPRHAGRALAVLQAWPVADTAPDDILLMQATLQQYLHEFDTASRNLELLVKRQPGSAQAWLTLATLRRVQGRYVDSDAGCRALAALPGANIYGQACLAENQSLRGEFAKARDALRQLQGTPGLLAETRAWLLTTLAETETRAGRYPQAEKAYRDALRQHADDYAALSFADFLIDNNRPADALPVLEPLPRTDQVVLRLAMAGTRLKTPQAAHDTQEMRDRIAQANLRPQAQTVHAREQAMFALVVENQPERALQLARVNLAVQREPIDVLLLARAARAAGQGDALREAARLSEQIGLKDARLDALR